MTSTLTAAPVGTTTGGKVIRVLIVDDSELVRLGLTTMLSAYPIVSVVGQADSVRGGVQEVRATRPDVVLLDIRLPDGSGLDACRTIQEEFPKTRVLILSSLVDDETVAKAIAAGAQGYLLKDINGVGLVQALLDCAAGKSILDPTVASRVLQLMKSGQQQTRANDRYALLSPQEQRVLTLVADGLTNKEIGQAMHLSEKTVKNYLSNLFAKLQIARRSQAAAFYAEVRSQRA